MGPVLLLLDVGSANGILLQERITSAKHTWAYLLERREEGTCDGVEPGGAGARILPAMTRLLPAYMRKYAASLAVIASRP